MSDVYSPEQLRLCGMAVAVDVEKDAISSARAMLAGIPGAFKKAMGSTLKRTATSGKAFAAKELRKQYFLKSADFKKYTHSGIKYRSDAAETSVTIEYKGKHIPLLRFGVQIVNGRVKAHVKRSEPLKLLHNKDTDRDAFVTTLKTGHRGIFDRLTEQRVPITELFGPSAPQMMKNNEVLHEKLDEHVKEVFKKRLDHEVTAILNGWRSV